VATLTKLPSTPSCLSAEGHQLAGTASAQPAEAVIDTETPAISRVYDYLLGGKHHYDVDRIACNAWIQAVPETPLLALANRAFVRRAVQYLTGG